MSQNVQQADAIRLDSERFCYLETRGRVSGRPHEVEMWYAAEGDCLYLLSGGRERSDWVKNLRRTPAVRVRIGQQAHSGLARVIEGEPNEALARRLLAAKYQNWREGAPLSEWARTALPVAILLGADGR